ncbi:MAG: 50S ribosomal protein L10 [Chloroflexi bacterium]|nr:50S ribosomal protein L10 [Chloroflexota bacterium]
MANREEKAQAIDEIAGLFERSSLAIVTDYRGLKTAELQALRRRLREAQVEYHVTKNTLTRFAAQRAGKDAVIPDLVGPTALAIAFGDPAAAAKALQDHLRTSRLTLPVRGAVIGNRRLSPDELQTVAELPALPQLQARLVGTVQSPMTGLVGGINSVLSQLAYTLDERAKQLGGEAA